jgi:hypothetical protein
MSRAGLVPAIYVLLIHLTHDYPRLYKSVAGFVNFNAES